ncbi:2-oxo acid dehydrogenase subunit E2 [bacterium]|nr:MAG: 2-oxo acid dehydrogenase subunit E2 [bacterium]
MTEVIMPKMGDGMEEGTLLEWLKKDGDKVKSGEVIGTIQTDKATLELESPSSGTLTGIKLEAGGTVPVGQPIAAILKDGESLPADWGGSKSVTPAATATPSDAPQDKTGAPSNAPIELQQAATIPTRPEAASGEFGVTGDQATAATNDGTEQGALAAKSPEPAEASAPAAEGRIKASPLARKVAAEKGIDLGQVTGTGPGGRIVEADVKGFTPKGAPAPAAAPVTTVAGEDKVVKLPRLRQITGKRTQESKQQVPHFYVTVEVDVENILALRSMFESQESGKVTINDFVLKACALALRDMPDINASINGDSLTVYGSVNVGIAVALADGLTVPVVKNADQLSLRQLSSRAKELAKKARDNKLTLDEMSGSTFAVSNMGMLDVDNFIAIVNQPNAAIVAIASVRKKAVVDEATGEIVARSRMNVTGSFDHRVCDGAGGAKFVNLIKNYLENPTRLLS